ncbi:hypothetical protein M413DRAFT_448388 [Hebeloma cylindrosporum]|uniref:RNA helicase n=1 Tax=Hebeloma cylindrosporum TaxID=76867 RepID=A0A0C3BZZ0_HEBCY|nr:hypothetical protein M413DRAFT_448388 [Hebeloma cylindrosporum h7]
MTSLYQRLRMCRRLPGCRGLHCTAIAAAKGEKFGRRSTRYKETQAANKEKEPESTPRKPAREPFTRDELPHTNRRPVPDRKPLSKLPSSSSGRQDHPPGRREPLQPWRSHGERGAVSREYPGPPTDSGEPPTPWRSRGETSSPAVRNGRLGTSRKDGPPQSSRNYAGRGLNAQNPVSEGYSERSRALRSRDTPTKLTVPGASSEPDLHDEFYYPPDRISVVAPSTSTKGKSKADESLPESFTSPPLLPGLVNSLHEMLGTDARPTPIQSLSIKCLLQNSSSGWREYLLASETGSGKSIAYLLPLLQHLKQAEIAGKELPPPVSHRLLNPRGLILAPTHELSRQLSGFAKSLLHEVKLRVLCSSQANVKSSRPKESTASKMASFFQDVENDSTGAFEVSKSNHPVSLVVGTPMKLLEMVRGRGWDRKEESEEMEQEDEKNDDENSPKPRRGRDKVIHFGRWKSKPELGLANVEWVIVDEADVLFDPDFQETTRTLLADISAARGHPVPVLPASSLSSPNASAPIVPTPEPITYPFNLILTSATIPKSLNTYLEKYHPKLIRLASPRLHHLPKTLQTEHVSWTGGNKFADILRRIKKIWAEDAAFSKGSGGLSKVLLFCNKSTKVVEFSAYLTEQGIKNVAMTSQSEHRGRGSNKHLEGFLRKKDDAEGATSTATSSDVKEVLHVMVTTSILSRGLDFSPDIKHVFIVDEPRNTIDFLHRAGRTGRAGQQGKVVIFGKLKGRGSQRARDTRKRIGTLAA